ncbi:MAG: hypothetical protein QNJ45_07775 [Ardenticatenaceae bacterium]|nr:hypothetical protein [Ardenticatenaceae bacterium]
MSSSTIKREEVIAGKKGGLGTFAGVFTPSILTILGVIMYLRFGWVVGQVGLVATLLIVTLSTAITFLTALSVAQIATDQVVRVGGAYYMISRSLGIELGGAIGVPLYLAQGLSIALYIIGFAESVTQAFPTVNMRVVGIVTTILVTILTLFSTQAAIRAQYFIMAAIALSLLSIAFGQPIETADVPLWRTVEQGSDGFWVVFAVFFPAVTGIMAGVNMSGDLEDPSKSIPTGTFAAVGLGYLIYMILPIILVLRVGTESLITDPLVMRKISYWGDAILLGVWGATLSSAVGSMLGAPRVLQALARDGVLPSRLRWLGKGSGKEDIPRSGTLLTAGVTLLAVGLGDLNVIAPVLTMFFLTTYGVLNVSAAVERLIGSPSFRPTFKIHWIWSFLGAIGCIAVMFLINAVATAIAFVFVLGLYAWLESRTLETAWGDVRQGVWMAITRIGLLRLHGAPDPKNWRPHLLVLSGAPAKRWHLIDLARALTHNRSLITVSTVLTDGQVTAERQALFTQQIREYLQARSVDAMVRVIRADTPFKGAEQLVDFYGLGALMPNTVLLGDTETPELKARYCQMVTHFYNHRRNVIILRHNDLLGFGRRQTIDVWWGGLQDNGALMLILAHLLQTGLDWPGAIVRLRMVVPSPEAAETTKANLEEILEQIRIQATFDAVVAQDHSFFDVLQEASQDADLILLGLAQPDDQFVSYFTDLHNRTDNLPSIIYVLAAEEIAFRDVLVQQ